MKIKLEGCLSSLSKESQETIEIHKEERIRVPMSTLIKDARRILKEAENLKSFGSLKGTLNGLTWNIEMNPNEIVDIKETNSKKIQLW